MTQDLIETGTDEEPMEDSGPDLEADVNPPVEAGDESGMAESGPAGAEQDGAEEEDDDDSGEGGEEEPGPGVLPGISPQARIRELMSIPDNQKTEAQWDELIELEIALAQGGRLLNLPAKQQKPQGKGQNHKGQKKPAYRPPPQASHGQESGKNADGSAKGEGGKPHGGQARKHGRRFFKKPGKPAPG